MTQKELVVEYIKEHGSMIPARMGGKFYKGEIFGSETSKRCRELRKSNVLESETEGKFEKFFLAKEPRLFWPGNKSLMI